MNNNHRPRIVVDNDADDQLTNQVSNDHQLELFSRSKRAGAGGILPPTERRGRPRGSQAKMTRILKEAALLAAEQVGENFKGKGGLVGYLRRIARTEPRAFTALLARILPLQVFAKLDIDVALR